MLTSPAKLASRCHRLYATLDATLDATQQPRRARTRINGIQTSHYKIDRYNNERSALEPLKDALGESFGLVPREWVSVSL